MVANLAVSLLLAVTSSVAALPGSMLATPFPDQGDPISAEAYTADLLEAEYVNGKLPTDVLIEIESNPGCLVEEEAGEAWRRLERHAKAAGVEFTASWCYRDMKTQRRTYRRNCPWVIVEPPQEPVDPEAPSEPADPGEAAGQETSPDDSAESSLEPGETAEPPTENPVERIRVCRVPTAKPGNSNHGWGRAIDITSADALLTCESEAFQWLTDNAARYGWVHPQWAACGADKEEAWHWEWGGTDYRGPQFVQTGQFAN